MTPVEIIGLVSTVITFIDFAAENVAVIREVAKSGSAAAKGNADLERRIKLLDDQIASLHRAASGPARDVHEAQLLNLLDEYKDLTVNLLSLLGGLKSTKKRHVLWQSAKNFLRKNEKESLVQDLDNCRGRIHLQLTQVMRHDLSQRLDNIDNQGKHQTAELRTLRETTKALENKMESCHHVSDLLKEVRLAVDQVEEALGRKARRQILETLWVEGMVDRFEEVEKAHEMTFKWIVDHNLALENETPEESTARHQVIDWLTQGRGIFHITGKPGAGKSTLMKFLCQNPKTFEYLNTWAGEKSLVTANFFFYRLGTKVQKSLDGLQRSLLYSILEKLPDLIPTVFPVLWKSAFDDRAMTIRASDVDTALEKLFSHESFMTSHRLVFFIDGLDEYDGDHDKMMKLLLRWAETYHNDIKICVSSREWELFTRRLAASPRIRLHDVTQRDIRQYVRRELDEDESFSECPPSSLDICSLVNQITSKSEGVFLWVRITLRGLKWSFSPGDEFECLSKRLDALPNELEALFHSIFDAIRGSGHVNRHDRKSTMRLLLTVLHCSDGTDGPDLMRSLVIFYSYLDDYEKDADFASKLPIRDIEESELEARLERTRRAILRQCLGLIDIYDIHDDDTARWFERDAELMNLSDEGSEDKHATDEIRDVVASHDTGLFADGRLIEDPSAYDDDTRHRNFRFDDGAKFSHRFPSRRGVWCIHRSVREFLRQEHIERLMRTDAAGFNEVDFHLQALLASFKMFRPSVHFVMDQLSEQFESLLRTIYLKKNRISADKLAIYFQELCTVLELNHLMVGVSFMVVEEPRRLIIYNSTLLVPPKLAFSLLLERFGIEGSLEPMLDTEEAYRNKYEGQTVRYRDVVLSNYLHSAMSILIYSKPDCEKARIKVLQFVLEKMTKLFEAGVSPNTVCLRPKELVRKSIVTYWHYWLLHFLQAEDPKDLLLPFMRLFLTYGADCNIWVKYESGQFAFWWNGAPKAHYLGSGDSGTSEGAHFSTVYRPGSRIELFLDRMKDQKGILLLGDFLPALCPKSGTELQRLASLNFNPELLTSPPPEIWAS